MKVFKFGGASLESIERFQKVGDILRSYPNEKLLVVISALGKTTNDLEGVVDHYYLRKRIQAAQMLHDIRQKHTDMALTLLDGENTEWLEQVRQFFKPVEWLMGGKPHNTYDYYYDQIVSLGELLSSSLLSAWLNRCGIANDWLDTRRIILTDDNYRDGGIQWDETRIQVEAQLVPRLETSNILVTQGFIGSTPNRDTTTLGREGSDYTAAVFANLMDAQSLTIWKDVEGLKNADPKLFPDTVLINSISYSEVIEMAYYGAQVIHPKTIKPLQNKKIPLYVKCFLDKDLPGTVIHGAADTSQLPPLIVLKKRQLLLTVTARDFSFITGDKISELYDIFHSHRIGINLMQNAAISFSTCINQETDKIERLIKTLHKDFTTTYQEGLELLTVRHYRPELIRQLTGDRPILLEQRSPLIVQLVMRQV